MTTKEYLNQIERLDKMITNKLSEIYQLKIKEIYYIPESDPVNAVAESS